MRRNAFALVAWTAALSMALAWPVPSMAQEKKAEDKKAEDKKAEDKKAEDKKAEKKKAEKASGDIGLLDTEKNYMILVTKEGKLITFDFDAKTKVIETKSSEAKMADVGLGSAATVEYQVKEDKALDAKIKATEEELNRLRNEQKKVVTKIDFVPAKGE
jgi:mannitol-specific phosphotransferase system IIBC component